MGLGGLLLLLLPDLLTPRGPSTPAPPLLCSPVGPGSPTSLILRGTSWMSRIGLPAKAQPWGQHACWGGGRRKNQGGDPEAPQCGWGPSAQKENCESPCPALLAFKTRRVTPPHPLPAPPPPPSVWFPRGPRGRAASGKAQPWTFQPRVQARGAHVGDVGGETEEETGLM